MGFMLSRGWVAPIRRAHGGHVHYVYHGHNVAHVNHTDRVRFAAPMATVDIPSTKKPLDKWGFPGKRNATGRTMVCTIALPVNFLLFAVPTCPAFDLKTVEIQTP